MMPPKETEEKIVEAFKKAQIAPSSSDQDDRQRTVKRLLFIGAGIGAAIVLLMSGLALILAVQTAQSSGALGANTVIQKDKEEDQAKEFQSFQKSLSDLQKKNEERVANGQAPISAPTSNDDLTDSITAKVLAAIPSTTTLSGETVQRVVQQVVSLIPLNSGTKTYVENTVQNLIANAPDAFRGPGPTQAQIQSAVTAYITANPPTGVKSYTAEKVGSVTTVRISFTDGGTLTFNVTDGVDGQNGINGQSPACLNTPEQCQGKNGTNGKDGPVPDSQEFEYTDGGVCALFTHYDNGQIVIAPIKNQSDSSKTAICGPGPQLPPETTSETPPPTTETSEGEG